MQAVEVVKPELLYIQEAFPNDFFCWHGKEPPLQTIHRAMITADARGSTVPRFEWEEQVWRLAKKLERRRRRHRVREANNGGMSPGESR